MRRALSDSFVTENFELLRTSCNSPAKADLLFLAIYKTVTLAPNILQTQVARCQLLFEHLTAKFNQFNASFNVLFGPSKLPI